MYSYLLTLISHHTVFAYYYIRHDMSDKGKIMYLALDLKGNQSIAEQLTNSFGEKANTVQGTETGVALFIEDRLLISYELEANHMRAANVVQFIEEDDAHLLLSMALLGDDVQAAYEGIRAKYE